eukprot:152778_1
MSTTKRDYNTLHSYASKAYKITKSSDQIRDWSKDTWNALKRLKVKNDMNNFERKFDEEIGKLNAILTEQQEQKKKKMERSTISRFLISKPNNKKIAKPIKKDKQEMDGSDDEKDDHKDNVSNTNNARAQQLVGYRLLPCLKGRTMDTLSLLNRTQNQQKICDLVIYL